MLNVPNVFEPVLQVTPTDLDFGEVPVGECASARIIISDFDGCHLHVSRICLDDPSDPAFTLLDLPGFPLTVPSETSMVFEVRFCPSRGGRASCSIEIDSDDPVHPVEHVTLHGEGV